MLQMSEMPRHILMTIDAVGGVWRYAMDLAAALAERGIETVFVGLGPEPSPAQAAEASRIGKLVWLDLPLDWLTDDPAALDALPGELARLVREHSIEIVHLNLPTQAFGLELPCPVVVASHSCVPTWFKVVRGTELPAAWAWHKERNAEGLRRADIVLVPSLSHKNLLEQCYEPVDGLTVVPNATMPQRAAPAKEALVLAAGRWWDEGKNGAVLDAAAGRLDWPVLMAGATQGPNGEAINIRNARVLGELSGSALRALMSRAAILASPSLYEPFGLAALEGASAGAALVLSDIPTYRELWDGAAQFVPPLDSTAWIAALNLLARDSELRETLGRSARIRAGRFTVAAQRDAVLSAYAAATRRFPESKRAA
ncbi:MAG TPA: glycosyltransferase family 4 protein [Devosiaceae bacterium]|nr:glycosyltransferase family 4 protein [Devosiaceae bacterium]